jgi:hypothetical protein
MDASHWEDAAQEQMLALPLHQRPDGNSVALVMPAGIDVDDWRLLGTRTWQRMPRWTDDNQGPDEPLCIQMFYQSLLTSPGQRGRKKNPERSKFT